MPWIWHLVVLLLYDFMYELDSFNSDDSVLSWFYLLNDEVVEAAG